MTAQTLLNESLMIAGQLGPARGSGASHSEVALRALNAMLGNWATQRLTVPVIRMDTFDLVADTQTYTLGVGGDWDMVRPVKINRANVISGDIHRPLDIITVSDWADLRLPALPSTIPDRLYNDRDFPLSTLRFYPVPDSAYSVELFTRQALAQIAALDTDLEFVPDPPGYEEAVKYNLAIRLKTLFPKALAQPPQQLALVVEIARESLANIKRMNTVTPRLRCEPAIGRTGGSSFDYRIGE